jgi:glycosyltransferase involved in cell wall biosynthesis
MKVAIVAPSSVPFRIGGAENLWWGLLNHFNQQTFHQADLIKLPSRENSFWELIDNYRNFSQLDLSHFDVVISTKYPAWMIQHPNHICYLQHKLRGLYDQCHPNFAQPYLTSDPEIAALQQFMNQNQGSRTALSEFYSRVDRLRDRQDLPADACQFPGALIREIVHFLDSIGLAPEAIKKYAAISHNVARRPNYFPAHCSVDVIYHPPILQNLYQGNSDYLFTVSRLEQGSKRIGLLIEAMRYVKANIQFKIAGTGADLPHLQQLAGGDPRIEFLGFINDQSLLDLYANALAVLYIPPDEDYGLVTVEAMMSGKPVITATDSGGTNEFVRNDQTGYSVSPDPKAIAERIDHLCAHPGRARQMGLAGLQTVKTINWAHTVNRLLSKNLESQASPAVVVPSQRRRKLTVALTYPIFPPRGGGASRIFNIFRHLAKEFDVELITFTEQEHPFCGEIAPGLWEIRTPMSKPHLEAEAAIRSEVKVLQISDVVMPQLYHLTPDYVATLQASITTSDVVVASHPYLLPAIQSCPKKPLLYEAQDVEFDIKVDLLSQQKQGQKLLKSVYQVEQDCCHLSDLILVCSKQDASRFQQLYSVSPDKIIVTPNGVDLATVRYVSLEERRLQQHALGLSETFTALFIGSWHAPNVDAVNAMLKMAKSLNTVNFLVLGNVAGAFSTYQPPHDDEFLQANHLQNNSSFLQMAYRSYLNRDIDDGARKHYLTKLDDHQLDRKSFLEIIKDSLEFTEKVKGSITLPPNFSFIGEVDDHTKNTVLGVVDVALNPVISGSGTNLKMMDYFANGIPVISTPFGARGLEVEHEKHCILAELENFSAAICHIRDEDDFTKNIRLETARKHVEKKFDWAMIAHQLIDHLQQLIV